MRLPVLPQVMTWNTIMQGYVKQGQYDKVSVLETSPTWATACHEPQNSSFLPR